VEFELPIGLLVLLICEVGGIDLILLVFLGPVDVKF
jgi:hypothetical protein